MQLGEFVSFIFIPMVFLGLYSIFNNTGKHYWLTFGAIGLILTHNMSAIITAVFTVIYLIININKLKEIKVLIIDLLFILIITSFFWIPMLETKYISNYQIYEAGNFEASENALNIKSIFATRT